MDRNSKQALKSEGRNDDLFVNIKWNMNERET
jgi:hypothetical protein